MEKGDGMAEALYRKYRPQTFEDVVGQTHIERTLKNAIESDKVSHAYLFCGPRGTGKTTTARLLAKALLCEHGPTPSPDGTCEQCLAIADGNHPDVNELDAASRTGVENVREEIIGRVQYAPTRGRYKIYIIDEVHMLSTAAFNALLKTLEEPPSHVVFILCTTDPQKVPETIHSRCQRFDFHRLSNDEIVSRLGAVCVSEGVEFEGDALDLAAHRAQGGMRDALTTLEQLIAFGGGKVTLEVAQSVLGSIDATDISTVVNGIAKRDAATCFTWLSEYVETGADLARFARDLAGYVRDLYVLVLTDGALAVDAPQASRASMASEAQSFGADRLAYVLRVLGDLNNELRTSSNPRLSFEIALTRMVRPESDLTIESLAARVAALEALVASGSHCAPQPSSAVDVAAASGGRSQDLAAGVSSHHSGDGAFSAGVSEPVYGAFCASDGEASAQAAPEARFAPTTPKASHSAAPQHSVAPQVQASVPPASSGFRSPEQRPVAPSASSVVVPPATVAHAAAAMDRAAAFRAKLEERRTANAAARQAGAESQQAPSFFKGASAAAIPATSSAASASRMSRQQTTENPSLRAQNAANVFSAAVRQEPSATVQAPPMQSSSGEVSAEVRAKISDPSALQRCWQAAIADLKRQRAAYGALLLSARASASSDGAKLFIEFPQENTFAFSAAQKPDFTHAASVALQAAFGGFVPFEVVQASASFAPQAAGGQAFGLNMQMQHAAAPASFGGASPYASDDAVPYTDTVPYTDADTASYADDVVSYDDADAFSYGHEEGSAEPFSPINPSVSQPKTGFSAPWDDEGRSQVLSDAASASASLNDSVSSRAFASAPSSSEGASLAEASAVLGVEGPEPVDPYLVGRELGFDSMPQPKKRRKGMIDPKGWPERGSVVSRSEESSSLADQAVLSAAADSSLVAGANAASVNHSVESTSTNVDSLRLGGVVEGDAAKDGTGAAADFPFAANVDEAAAAESGFGPNVDAPSAAVPSRPNPFASRPMPAGIGVQAPSDQASFANTLSNGDEMDVADIFGSFGVSFDSVQEE